MSRRAPAIHQALECHSCVILAVGRLLPLVALRPDARPRSGLGLRANVRSARVSPVRDAARVRLLCNRRGPLRSRSRRRRTRVSGSCRRPTRTCCPTRLTAQGLQRWNASTSAGFRSPRARAAQLARPSGDAGGTRERSPAPTCKTRSKFRPPGWSDPVERAAACRDYLAGQCYQLLVAEQTCLRRPNHPERRRPAQCGPPRSCFGK